jgi:hypothetical protein
MNVCRTEAKKTSNHYFNFVCAFTTQHTFTEHSIAQFRAYSFYSFHPTQNLSLVCPVLIFIYIFLPNNQHSQPKTRPHGFETNEIFTCTEFRSLFVLTACLPACLLDDGTVHMYIWYFRIYSHINKCTAYNIIIHSVYYVKCMYEVQNGMNDVEGLYIVCWMEKRIFSFHPTYKVLNRIVVASSSSSTKPKGNGTFSTYSI